MKRLIHYIQGNKKGKEAHKLEYEAMQDPFLNEALDGYEEVGGENHSKNIKELQNRILAKTRIKQKPKNSYWYIAASILFLLGISSYFYFHTTSKQENIANTSIALPEESITEEIEKSVLDENKNESEDNLITTTEENKKNSVFKEGRESSEEKEDNYNDLLVYRDAKKNKIVKDYHTNNLSLPTPVREKILNKSEIESAAADSDFNLEDSSHYDTSAIAYDKIQDDERIIVGSYGSNKNKEISEIDNKQVNEKHTSRKSTIEAITPSVSDRADISLTNTTEWAIPITGLDSYHKYLKDNIKLSNTDSCLKQNNTAIIHFLITSKGRPENITIIQSICPAIDQQLIELIKNGVNWENGIEAQIIFTSKQ